MRPRHLLWPLLTGWPLLPSCKQVSEDDHGGAVPHTAEHGAPHGGPNDGDSTPNSRVVIDASLLESGRILLSPATAAASDPSWTVPGEVVSDPRGEALVGSLAAGRIRSLQVDVGDEVKKGTVLATVDAPEVARARASLAQAQARLALAESQLARQRQLKDSEATSQRAFDQAEATQKAAAAEVDSTRALLASWGAGSGAAVSAQLSITSPIDGFVADRSAILGEAVRPEETLFHVVAPDRIVILAQWPETRLVAPSPGTTLDVRSRGSSSKRTCQVKVETRGRVVDPRTRTVTLRLRPEGTCPELLPGSFVSVMTAGRAAAARGAGEADAEPPVVEIPRLSVVDVRGVSTVFVAEQEPGHFVARSVVIRPSEGDTVVVESGVSLGEQVASRGVILLKGQLLGDSLGGH